MKAKCQIWCSVRGGLAQHTVVSRSSLQRYALGRFTAVRRSKNGLFICGCDQVTQQMNIPYYRNPRCAPRRVGRSARLGFLLEMFSFCQESWEVVKNIRFHSVNMTCRSILVFEISARKVQFLSEILGSGQKHKVSFGKYDMAINSRSVDFCSKCSVSVRNVKNLKK